MPVHRGNKSTNQYAIKSNRSDEASKRRSQEGTRTEGSRHFSAALHLNVSISKCFLHLYFFLITPKKEERSRENSKQTLLCLRFIDAVLGLTVSRFECRIQTSATCWYGVISSDAGAERSCRLVIGCRLCGVCWTCRLKWAWCVRVLRSAGFFLVY